MPFTEHYWTVGCLDSFSFYCHHGYVDFRDTVDRVTVVNVCMPVAFINESRICISH